VPGARIAARAAGEHRRQADEQQADEHERVARPDLRAAVRDAHRRQRLDALAQAGEQLAPAARIDERQRDADDEQRRDGEQERDGGGRGVALPAGQAVDVAQREGGGGRDDEVAQRAADRRRVQQPDPLQRPERQQCEEGDEPYAGPRHRGSG
jgi:hypothetical protein